MAAVGSDALIQATVVRDTQPGADGHLGRGLVSQADDEPGVRGTLPLRASVIERNHEAGVSIAGCDATMEATIVRDGHAYSILLNAPISR